ncbi:MAG: glutathione S-transferase family protein [Alphaproteobacteria bacterium]
MRMVYHLWLSPASRKVRLTLGEKKLEFDLAVEKTWERRPEFLALNPTGKVPVMVEDDGAVYADSQSICEYLDESVAEPPLIGRQPAVRAEVRRLVAWFDEKFRLEVTDNLVGEKVLKRFLGLGEPSVEAIRAGIANVHNHLEYVSWLADSRNWLAGDDLSLADLAAAAHLSCLDYLGDVPWEDHPRAKEWYAKLKSRPSFRPLLKDSIPGLLPPKHYTNLDF